MKESWGQTIEGFDDTQVFRRYLFDGWFFLFIHKVNINHISDNTLQISNH